MTQFFITAPKKPNFSWRDAQRVIRVPIEQQMVVYQTCSVQDGGELDLEGELVILD